jgi:hypothetical protein
MTRADEVARNRDEELRRAVFMWAEERRRREVAEAKLADADAYISSLKGAALASDDSQEGR